MKRFLIPIIVLLLLVRSNVPTHAMGPSGPLQNMMDSLTGKDKKDVNSEKTDEKDSQEDEGDISPSPTVSPIPVSPSPTPIVTIVIPPIDLPVIGGINKDDEKDEEKNAEDRKDKKEHVEVEEEEDISAVSSQPMKAPVSVQRSQRQRIESAQQDKKEQVEKKTPVAAIVTKPIDPPRALVRGAVKGTFYSPQGLSQQVTFYSLLVSFTFFSLGALLLRGQILSLLMKRGRSLPLPQREPVTIPYIGRMYK